MHREIEKSIEDVLDARRVPSAPVSQHLKDCPACSEAVEGMQEQAAWLHQLRAPAEVEPAAGFYARVLQRIEAAGPVSIWNLFIESTFGRRIAMASLALALLLGVYVVTAERTAPDAMMAAQPSPLTAPNPMTVMGEDAPGRVITQMDQSVDNDPASTDAVLANLVTYNEQ